jgi:hypothetical protein
MKRSLALALAAFLGLGLLSTSFAGFAQDAHGSLLNTIGECSHQEIATESGRIALEQAAPFRANRDDACLL